MTNCIMSTQSVIACYYSTCDANKILKIALDQLERE